MKKSTTRRKFIKKTGLVSLGISLLGSQIISCGSKTEEKNTKEDKTAKKLKILILGGTSFLGPHQIAYAINRGHSIATFTRGKTVPTIYSELFKNVEQLIGDRENDLKALKNKKWDVVIDNSGHKVEWTKKTAELLKDNVGTYVYISSTGVYYPYLSDNINEETKLLLKEPDVFENEDEKLEYWYGVMKANSELEAIKAFGKNRSLIVRPTYMMGPADRTDRFTYWPIRLSKGGEVLVPGKSDDPVQYIDVRDVAEWTIRLIEEEQMGAYNAVGPKNKQTMTAFVNEAKTAFDVESTLVNVDDYEFLKENEIPYLVPWIMPEGKNYGSSRVTNEKALKAGLTFRPLKTSVKDIYEWWNSDALTDERRNKLEADPKSLLLREQSVLEKWKKLKK